MCPASILYKSIAGRYQPVSYPGGPITARYRFIKNAYWVCADWPSWLFTIPLGVIGRICSVIASLAGRLRYYFGAASELNPLCRVDSSTSSIWAGPFPIEGVSG